MTKAELEAELRYERLASSPGKRFCLFPFPQHFSSHIVSAIVERTRAVSSLAPPWHRCVCCALPGAFKLLLSIAASDGVAGA
jgi:hypothetical protein